MASKRLRFCLFCHKVGITVEFPTGNALRLHVKTRHPQTREQLQRNKNTLREYRRDVLLVQARLRKGTT